MAECLIHIGWHKTGSTSLQKFLKINAPALEKAGWFSPVDEPFRYMYPAISSQTNEKYYYGDYFSPPHSKFTTESRQKDSLLKFKNAIKQSNGKNLIISAEDLCLLNIDEIKNLKELLLPHFNKISIFCNLRSHTSYFKSAIQQLIKMGFPYSSIQNIILGKSSSYSVFETVNPVPNYGRKIAIWTEHFGRNNIFIKNFDNYKKDPLEIYRSLLSQMTTEISLKSLEIPSNLNESLSLQALYILNRLNKHNKLLINGKPSPIFIMNTLRYFKHIEGDKLTKLPKLMIEPIRKEFESDIQILSSLGFSSKIINFSAPRAEEFNETETIFNKEQCINSNIEASFYNLSVESQNRLSREKFFSILLHIEKNGVKPLYLSQLNNTLFLMTNPKIIKSSANWLTKINLPYEANKYFQKAKIIEQIY